MNYEPTMDDTIAADNWDQDALDNNMTKHYLNFYYTDFYDFWYIGVKNYHKKEELIFFSEFATRTYGESLCLNDCSSHGTCVADFTCQCETDYLYKDCSVSSEKLETNEQMNFEIKELNDKKYFHIFAYQDTVPTTELDLKYQTYDSPLKPGLPMSAIYFEFKALSGMGQVFLMADNKQDYYLPNENYNDKSTLFEDNGESVSAYLNPWILRQFMSTRIILVVEAKTEDFEFDVKLVYDEKGKQSLVFSLI
jgi:hypothetical protein